MFASSYLVSILVHIVLCHRVQVAASLGPFVLWLLVGWGQGETPAGNEMEEAGSWQLVSWLPPCQGCSFLNLRPQLLLKGPLL